MKKNIISIIDTFTNKEFTGNPAAVYHMFENKSNSWMQNFAAEMNLSETAFLKKKTYNYWYLKWFTPKTEVDLCGHGTLASAHYLWSQNLISQNDVIKFNTNSGILECVKDKKYIYMYFPLLKSININPIIDLSESLGKKPEFIRKTKWDLIAIYKNYQDVINLVPKFNKLKKFSTRGVIVTAPGNKNYNFFARFFAPNLRINEDYVTGSIYCSLAPYWSKRLGLTNMTAYQASERTGIIRLKVSDNKVRIGGQAKTIIIGKSI
ncbi:MAG: putative isomerase YddE [Alphaproteobacteria bacterium MarineAlpha2_Bin1]|nr:MAG: putative isomerase YddE [Alphaproteobacteria bacterium MarineAlpha2_Bin1]|tara:strand:+ start:694 stop:1485 length:792 start_codon:yes stop_codon:yes gene_type:complete